MVKQPRLMAQGEPLSAEAWEAIMDEAENGASWAASYGIENVTRTDTSIVITYRDITYVDTPVRIGFQGMFETLFQMLFGYTGYIVKIHLPYKDYAPSDGMPDLRELAANLFGEDRMSGWDYNHSMDFVSMFNSDDKIELIDGAGTVYTIEYIGV